MIPIELLGWVVALPLAVGLLAAMIARRGGSENSAVPRAISIELSSGALAVGAAGFALTGWTFAPAESLHWIPWTFLALGAWSVLEARSLTARAWRFILRLAFVGAALALALKSVDWPRLSLFALGVSVLAELAGRAAARLGSPIAECAWVATAAATLVLILSAGYLTLALFAASLAASFGGAALVGFRRRADASLLATRGRFAFTALALLALESHYYATPEYSPWLWCLVVAGSFCPVLVTRAPTRTFELSRFLIAAAAALAPLALAAALALSTYGGSES